MWIVIFDAIIPPSGPFLKLIGSGVEWRVGWRNGVRKEEANGKGWFGNCQSIQEMWMF